MELVEVINGKLHGIKITECALHYHGSVSIDEEILRAVNFIPMEFVHIWNKNSGSRISTYVLPAPAGSKVVCLNGAAARSCQIGDEVIISSWRNVTPDELKSRKSRIVTFKHDKIINTMNELLEYDLSMENQDWKFKINDLTRF